MKKPAEPLPPEGEQKLAEDRRRSPPYLAFGRGFVSTEDNYGAADAKIQRHGNGCVYVAEYICDERDRRHDAEIDRLVAVHAADDYVAWCRYLYDEAGGIQSIETCDSDAKGAFKVYRHPAELLQPTGEQEQGAQAAIDHWATMYRKVAADNVELLNRLAESVEGSDLISRQEAIRR